MNGRIVIISDTHLGRPRPGSLLPGNLRPLWQQADHLVINGDIAEVHHPQYRGRAARLTMELVDLCEIDGVSLTLLSGNHDPYLSDIRHLHLADDTVLVTHGDAVHPAIAPWSPAAGRLRMAYDRALESLAPEDRSVLAARLQAAQHAAHAEWGRMAEEADQSSVLSMLLRPRSLIQVLAYWRDFPRLASSFVQRHAPDASFVVMGHTHRAGIWKIRERVIINTGSFIFPGRPRAVVIEDDLLTVMQIRRVHGRYQYDPEPIAVYKLPVAPSPSARPSAPKTRPVSVRSRTAAM